jgi:hypothetical protein
VSPTDDCTLDPREDIIQEEMLATLSAFEAAPMQNSCFRVSMTSVAELMFSEAIRENMVLMLSETRLSVPIELESLRRSVNDMIRL